jgi:hypothetical protein
MQPSEIRLCQQLFARPVLVVSVWQVPPHDQWDLLLLQFLCSNLERIRHALYVDENRSITTAVVSSFPVTRVQLQTHLICRALVPNTRARSYFVMYGVVVRLSLSTLLSFSFSTVFFTLSLAAAAALASPETTMLSSFGSWLSGSSAPPAWSSLSS